MTKRPRTASSSTSAGGKTSRPLRKIAIVGAGIAGIACARTLMQAGLDVTVFEKSTGAGGRMATRSSEFGGFDHGAQYFTVRDARFEKALTTASGLVRPWSANTVRILDELGRVVASSLPPKESHWVATPGMNSLVRQWAQPLAAAGKLVVQTQVTRIEADKLHPECWQLQTEGPDAQARVHSGFDAVVLAIPSPQASALLLSSQQAKPLQAALGGVTVAPCWTLMLAFPQAVQPNLAHLGPQWNAARSTHHRIAWLARESSKPGREPGRALDRAGQRCSGHNEHLQDDAAARAGQIVESLFTEVTGIRAEPAACCRCTAGVYAQTIRTTGQKPRCGMPKRGIGVCGDWCLGHRVEDAFMCPDWSWRWRSALDPASCQRYIVPLSAPSPTGAPAPAGSLAKPVPLAPAGMDCTRAWRALAADNAC